jgi:hypothetical protein
MTDQFPGLYKGRMAPPFNAEALNNTTGGYADIWEAHHQSIADTLNSIINTDLKGVTDGSEAAAGDVGEYLTVTSGSVALSNTTLANVVSLNLTAGDWDVQGNVTFAAGSGTHTFFGAGIGVLDTFTSSTFPSAALNQAITTVTRRYNVAATTTVWLVAEAGFGGTMTATGTVRARRMR